MTGICHGMPLPALIAFMKKRIAIDRARFTRLMQQNRLRPSTADDELRCMEAILHALEERRLQELGQLPAGLPDEATPPPAPSPDPHFEHRRETFAEARARLAANPPAPGPEPEHW